MSAQNKKLSLSFTDMTLLIVGEKPKHMPYMNLQNYHGEMIGCLDERNLTLLCRCLMRRLRIKEAPKRSANSRNKKRVSSK